MLHTQHPQQHSPPGRAYAARPAHSMLLRQTLVELANAARFSLERTPRSERIAEFDNFPQGAGGAATELFGRLVLERTGHEGTYVCGTCHPMLPPQQSHAWLEVGGLIVDLTHDQFAGTGLQRWVFRDSPWHDNFACECVQLLELPERWVRYPHAAYTAMKRAADAL